jgi:hypothetical protein
MHFKSLFATVLGLATPLLVAGQAGFCPEAARFGSMQITPTTLAPGDVRILMCTYTLEQLCLTCMLISLPVVLHLLQLQLLGEPVRHCAQVY